MKKKLIFIVSTIIIIVLSFLTYSSNFFPLLNSDDAISILMTHYFKLPHDLYYWGQDRYGSLIPLIGQFFKLFHIKSITAESLSHYLILILGYLSFSTLFKSNFSKIVFAIIWFFPLFHFVGGLLRFNFGVHYSLLAIGIYLIRLLSKNNIVSLKRYFILFSITILMILAVWVSDTAIITIFIIFGVLLLSFLKEKREIISLSSKPQTYFVFVGTVICALFIWYAKSQSVRVSEYNEDLFNNSSSVLKAAIILKDTIVEIFTFKIDNQITSVYAYLVIGILVFFFLFVKRKKHKPDNSNWINIFLLDGIAVILLTLVSTWALLNNMPRRYFTGAYISFWLAFLIYLDNYHLNLKLIILRTIIVVTILIGVYSPFHYYLNTNPRNLKPAAKNVAELETLGEIGILAEYWNSYISSVTNPDMVKSTPNDWSLIRNHDMIDSVFAQPKLFVIKDMWLDSFPEFMYQHGYKLKIKGESFNLGNCCLNEYEIIEKPQK